ncbi:hypothetical protein [Priestia megaterium]|jgi:hypothetical protein|nr:hypothetical protein [Priestia megaterium]MED3934457.1 hypothetical protein [Priestia megaterium]
MDGANARAKSFVMKEKELKDITGDVKSAGFLYAGDWTIEAAFT